MPLGGAMTLNAPPAGSASDCLSMSCAVPGLARASGTGVWVSDLGQLCRARSGSCHHRLAAETATEHLRRPAGPDGDGLTEIIPRPDPDGVVGPYNR